MRKILVLGLLCAAIAAISMFPLRKSDAQKVQRQGVRSNPIQIPNRGLPDFDIRLIDRGEFADLDLNSSSGKQRAMQTSKARTRASAVDQFRSSLKPEHSANLRAVVNEAGAMKNLFVDGGTLSDPQSDSADNIARRFLKGHSEMFAL